jgi:hypothetical protein
VFPIIKTVTQTFKVERKERNGEEMPTTLIFKDGDGNRDQYRFMSKESLGPSHEGCDVPWR